MEIYYEIHGIPPGGIFTVALLEKVYLGEWDEIVAKVLQYQQKGAKQICVAARFPELPEMPAEKEADACHTVPVPTSVTSKSPSGRWGW